jgi:hypothetical protein
MSCPYLPNPQVVDWKKLKERRERNAHGVTMRNVSLDPFVAKDGSIRVKFIGGCEVPGAKTLDSFPLFTYTSKMNAASFSLPAGLGDYHGTCPASNQRMIEESNLAMPLVDPGTLNRRRREGLPYAFTCSVCYAAGGRYSWAKYIHISQMARKFWVQKLLAEGRGSGHVFAEVMTRALTMLTTLRGPLNITVGKKCDPGYFRIHDSGDFHVPAYMEGWCMVAASMPHVKFWAPTRVWIFQQMAHKFYEVAARFHGLPNMTMRPSALYISSPPPAVAPFAAGSMCAKRKQLDADPPLAFLPDGVWDCPAYQGDSAQHTCYSQGCRKCWDSPRTPISYSEH